MAKKVAPKAAKDSVAGSGVEAGGGLSSFTCTTVPKVSAVMVVPSRSVKKLD